MIEFIAGCFVGVAAVKKVRVIREWKVPTSIKIVDMGGGKYSVRKGWFSWTYAFLGLDDAAGMWWSRTYVEKYCLSTLERCQRELDILSKPRNDGKPI